MQTLLYYSPPGSKEYRVFREVKDSELQFDFVPFTTERKRIRVYLEEIDEAPEPSLPEAPAGNQNYSRENYLTLIQNTARTIAAERWGKVVISRPLTLKMKSRPLLWFHALREQYPRACVYLFHHEDSGTWMGASPELLISCSDGLVNSMSLAGTRKKGEEHSFTAKEEEEQAIVTRYILRVLTSAKGLSAVEVMERSPMEAGNLVHFVNHLQADVTGKLDVEQLLHELHPTPAVGGYPRQEALQYIFENERHKRDYYTGYFGLKNPEAFHYYVNLRCMQVYSDAVTLYAGGGILADSVPADEWEETEAKMQTLLKVIQDR